MRFPNSLRSRSSNCCSITRTRGVGVPRAAAEVVVVDRVVERLEEGKEKGGVLRVGVVCGGPSAERGISLNSARSVLDHIQVIHTNMIIFTTVWLLSN